MPQQLLKNFSIDIQQKLFEKETDAGVLAVYQTHPFGMILTIGGQIILSQEDGFFYQEMMAHPALFTHPNPKKVAILGAYHGILEEVLKHANVGSIVCASDNAELEAAIQAYFPQQKTTDGRVQFDKQKPLAWLKGCTPHTFDLIIQSDHHPDFSENCYRDYHHILSPHGMLVQPCKPSLLHLHLLKPILQNIQQAGFKNWQLLHFPQPSYPSGWRSIMMATKSPLFNRIREKDIYNRHFKTRYYNFDTHKAALALPEYAREELTSN